MRQLCIVVFVLMFAGTALGRGMRSWSYAQLTDAADVVVIITPTKTKLRPEKAPLPDIGNVIAQRVETEFSVQVVLKGTLADPKQLVLHHYKDIRTGPIGNGPMLVSFEPNDKLVYVAFLKKGADGQYIAVTGQTDPHYSFEKLQQKAR